MRSVLAGASAIIHRANSSCLPVVEMVYLFYTSMCFQIDSVAIMKSLINTLASQSYFFRVETSVSVGFGASGFETLLTSMVSISGGERQCQDKERAWLSFHFPSLLSTCLISFSLPINGYSAPT